MKNSLNLLSQRSHKRNLVRRCVRCWSRILLVAVTVLAGVGLVKWRAYSQKAALQASAEAEYEPIRQLSLEISRLKKQITELEKAEVIPLKLAVDEPLLALLGIASQAVSSQQQRVYLSELEIEREPLTLESSSISTTTVLLEGFSADKPSSEQLAESVRKLGPFRNVQLRTQSPAGNNNAEPVKFMIECTNRTTDQAG